jgi:hypothetical protein
MSGGGTTQVQKNEIDPQLKALYMQNYGTAMNVANAPFQAYTGQRVAPLNTTQNSANDLFRGIAAGNIGQAGLDSAKSAASGLTDFTPQTVNANPVTAGLLRDTDLSAYMNPYTQDVINSSLDDLARARDIQRVADDQHATMAHAFGGSRQGVADSLTNDNYFRNVASTTANLRNTGYNAAVDAATADINRRLGADQFNSGQAFNAAQINAGNDLAGANFRLGAANSLANFSDMDLSQALQRAGALGAAGSVEQQNQQAQDDFNYQEFLRQIAYPQQQQDIRNSALGIIPRDSTSTTSQSSTPSTASLIGTGLSAAALA